jgi:hypothetical protein
MSEYLSHSEAMQVDFTGNLAENNLQIFLLAQSHHVLDAAHLRVQRWDSEPASALWNCRKRPDRSSEAARKRSSNGW